MHLSTDGRLNVLADGATRHALSEADIEASTDLSITEPLTQVVINAKRVKSDNGKLSFDDVEITMGDQNRLPPQLTAMQKSLTIDSDMLAVDESGGVWNSGPVATVSDTDRANIAQWLESNDLRMVPENVTFNSTRIDPARLPWLYKASPSGPFIIVKAKASAPDRLRWPTGLHRPHHDHRRDALIPVAQRQTDTHPGATLAALRPLLTKHDHMGRPAHPQLAAARHAHLRSLDDPDHRHFFGHRRKGRNTMTATTPIYGLSYPRRLRPRINRAGLVQKHGHHF